MRSSVSVEVRAPSNLVFELARDVERWPQLLPHYQSVHVLERHADKSISARMVAVRRTVGLLVPGIPVTWRARVWFDEDELRLRFRHRGGATNGMDVTWFIQPTASGCRVRIEHQFEPRVPGWAILVDVLFVRPIARRTLAAFKAIAEAADAASRPRGSNRAATAKESA